MFAYSMSSMVEGKYPGFLEFGQKLTSMRIQIDGLHGSVSLTYTPNF
jgi:hypothetical protein